MNNVLQTIYQRDILTSVIDPNDHTTTYVYEDFGRKKETTSPDTRTTRYEYAEAENLVKKVDTKGTVGIYTWSLLESGNTVIQINFPHGFITTITSLEGIWK